MTNQTFSQNQDTHKAETEQLLEQAIKQLEEAFNSYQQALDISQDIDEDAVTTFIYNLISKSKILTTTTTDESGNSKINFSAATSILANRSRINRRRR